MRRFLCGATALTLLTATLAWAGGEQKKKKIIIPVVPAKQAAEAPAEPDATTLAVEALIAAQTLADVGRETKAPELLIAAARVIGKASYGKLDTKDAKIESEAKELTPAQEAETLIAEALEMGGPNAAAIKTLAASLREDLKEAPRGAVGGPKTRVGRVDAKYDKIDTYYFDFRGGRVAIINVANLSSTFALS